MPPPSVIQMNQMNLVFRLHLLSYMLSGPMLLVAHGLEEKRSSREFNPRSIFV